MAIRSQNTEKFDEDKFGRNFRKGEKALIGEPQNPAVLGRCGNRQAKGLEGFPGRDAFTLKGEKAGAQKNPEDQSKKRQRSMTSP